MVGSIFLLGVFLFILKCGRIIKEKGNTKISNYIYSVAGFSVEYAMLNPCNVDVLLILIGGFFFYSFYSVAGYIDSGIGAGTVRYLWYFIIN